MRNLNNITLILLSLLLTALLMSNSHAVEQTEQTIPKVVVTIKPVYSLVASIMKGAGEPALLISGNTSPHHTSLKPSQRKLMAEADILFWISPALESFMPRLINASKRNNIKNIELSQIEDLLRLPARRSANDHYNHEHQDNKTHDHETQTSESQVNESQTRENLDPHIWLHTSNLAAMANEITEQLSQHNPSSLSLYKKNNQLLQQKISTLKRELEQTLAGVNQSYISYHDAYQYFEHEFNLNFQGVVSNNENIKPGARHLRQLRKDIQEKNIHCVFYEAPTSPPLLNTLLNGLDVNTQAIDASGLLMEASENSIFTVLQTLGANFRQCLSTTD